MSYILIVGDLHNGISTAVGPFDTPYDAEVAQDNLGLEDTILVSMETEDEYREGMLN